MARNTLLPIGDGTEMMDTLYPIFRLSEEGFNGLVAGPEAFRDIRPDH